MRAGTSDSSGVTAAPLAGSRRLSLEELDRSAFQGARQVPDPVEPDRAVAELDLAELLEGAPGPLSDFLLGQGALLADRPHAAAEGTPSCQLEVTGFQGGPS